VASPRLVSPGAATAQCHLFPEKKTDDFLVIALYLKFWINWPRSYENTNFQLIFARSTSAVTPKIVEATSTIFGNTLRKGLLLLVGRPLRAFQSYLLKS